MTGPKEKKYYHQREALVLLKFNKQDGTPGKAFKGTSADGKVSYTVVPANDGAVRLFVEDVTNSPTPPKR